MDFTVRSIATVRATRHEVIDDNWDGVSASIELASDVPDEALLGIEDFSHVEVIFIADQASDVPPAPWSRHPRGNESWPRVGIFVNRNKDRPNRILATICQVLAHDARSVSVRGLDAVDGTPVLDIKPVFAWSGPRGEFFAAPWSDELGRGYF
jgi:tRNA (Thr-GGU) A37 N-methylase